MGPVFGRTGKKQVQVEFGQWTKEAKQEELSKFQEMGNLVIKVIRMAKIGQIRNELEVFFTDDGVMEGTFTKGSSRSLNLHNLIVELHQLKWKAR